MSAIIGIVGGEERQTALDSMRRDVDYRVRNGWSTFSAEGVGIGIGLTRVLPEDPFQATIFGDDEARLICDARLDNRSELIKVLNAPMQDISDGNLIFLAYRRWGQQLCHYLLGDFVIAVWNTKTRHLFLARDQVGIKPLFYRHVDGAFAFCSDAKALTGLEATFGKTTFADIEESRILEFVAGVPPRDHVILISSLKRLPPGHTLDFDTPSAPVLTCYWQPRAARSINSQNTEMQFREIFDLAVQSRLRSSLPIACLLSGGLDSSSIACSAANTISKSAQSPVKTVSAVFDLTPDLNERTFIESVLKRHNFEPHFVAFDDYAPFQNFQEILRPHWRLINAPGIRMTSRLMQAARETGAGVLLHGHGGDEVVSHGFGRLNDLAIAGRWLELWKEAGAVSRLYGQSRLSFLMISMLKYSRFPLMRLARYFAKKHNRARGKRPSLLKPGSKIERDHSPGLRPATESDRHMDDLRSIRHVESIETIEVTAARAGLEVRFPFYDIRLIEFCLSLPAEAKLANGWTRLIMRKAMDGLIPSNVQWRSTKFDFSPHLARGLYNHHKDAIEVVIAFDHQHIGRFVDIEYLKQQFSALAKDPLGRGVDVQAIWRALSLNEWLKNFSECDGDP